MNLLTSPRLILALTLIAFSVVGPMIAAERAASNMATAATRLLDSLTSAQRADATFELGSDEREKFHFIPTEMFPRNGVTIRDMTDEQRARAHDLLSSGLSQRGYLTATAIMDLEAVLRAIENGGRMDRDPETYFFSIFGTPSSEGAWGWRGEGHHLSLHFTIVDGEAVASSPSFFGANPAQVRTGPKAGLRALREREDADGQAGVEAAVRAFGPAETYAGEGANGVRLEDEVVVTETGTEIITKFPTDVLIGCGMSY